MFFSVILSTYARGRHIVPTIQSVLAQEEGDFELLVVGDGCQDDTASVVEAFSDPRVRWFNLDRNFGSQSGPNNLGIANAGGHWIAYIGHDDVWCRDHLKRLRKLSAASPAAEILVSGCVFHGPPGSGFLWVTGIFDNEVDKDDKFFPPSSLAHRTDLTDRIGPWGDPRTLALPVDADLLARASQANATFASTKHISVHKFAAGHRYLSYLAQDSYEQRDMLTRLQSGKVPGDEELIDAARSQGRFMSIRLNARNTFKPGEKYEAGRTSKGLMTPQTVMLKNRLVVTQTGERRGLDWYPPSQAQPSVRWSGPNPHPRILVPVACDGPVRITLLVADIADGKLDDVSVWVAGKEVATRVGVHESGAKALIIQTPPDLAGQPFITLHTPNMTFRKGRKLGIAVGDIIFEPDQDTLVARAKTRLTAYFDAGRRYNKPAKE